MVSSIAPLRYARARDLARGRRGPRRDAAVELRAGAVPAPRVRRRARARAAGPSAGAGNRRARLRRRARARRASRPPPARSSPRSTTPRWWPPWRRSARSRSPRRWRWRCRRTRTRWCWVCAGWRERPRCTCLGTPDAARVGLGPAPPRVHKSENLSFGEQAQAVLRNLILVEASIPEPWERVAVFGFAARPGDPVAIRLRVETQGRNSNAMLTSEDDADADDADARTEPRSKQLGTIVACAYQVGASQTSVRPSSPGFACQPPPCAAGISPDAFGEIPGGLADALASARRRPPPRGRRSASLRKEKDFVR